MIDHLLYICRHVVMYITDGKRRSVLFADHKVLYATFGSYLFAFYYARKFATLKVLCGGRSRTDT